MSEFTLSCEQFLAATRQHFFAVDGVSSAHLEGDDDFSGDGGATAHRAVTGG